MRSKAALLLIATLLLAACGGGGGEEAGGGAASEGAAAEPSAEEGTAAAEGSEAAGEGDAALAGLVYGIPSPLATEPGEHNINLGITCFAEANGGEVVTLDANLDVNKQINDFDNLLAQGAQVLPFLPLDPNAFEGPFERADEAGAVVVELYNPNSNAPGKVYENSRAAGEDAVELVAEQFPDGAKALVIGGPPIPAVIERIGGFIDNAEEHGIEILEQADNLQDNVNDARTLADDLLTKHPDAQVVFGFNDNSAVGAGLAAESRGMDLMIFGINGTQEGIDAVRDGTITATYEADQWLMGYTAAEMGAKLTAGVDTETDVAVDMKRWDESNADEWQPAEEKCAAQTGA
jgi:ribose transport system substrate-binding protein